MKTALCPICFQPLAQYDHDGCRVVANERRAQHKPMTPADIAKVKAMFKGSPVQVKRNYFTMPNGTQVSQPKSGPARLEMLDLLDALYSVPEHNTN